MARDPNERIGNPVWLESDKDLKDEHIAIPAGYVVGQSKGQYYAAKITHADGHTTIEWYQRQGKGEGEPDPVATTTPGPLNPKQQTAWTDAAAKEKPSNVYVGVNPTTGKPSQVTEAPDPTAPGGVRRTYDDTQVPATAAAVAASAEPPKEKDEGGRRYRWEPNPGGVAAGGQWVYVGPAPATPAERAAQAAQQPQVVTGTLNTTSPQYALVGPDGSVVWQPNPNYQNPSPKPISLPNTRTIIWDNGDGTTRTEKNPNYVKPSKLVPHPSDPRKWVNVTEDDNGNPVILPVDDKTTIKPADLPVLQSKYGDIAQGLGRLAQDLNARVARQEITAEERKEAFTAAYKQAETQVSEINSILDNSKAIWSGQVTQRGQTLSETQSRRSFASDAAGRAIAAGNQVAQGALPGHGKEIAAGVEALMRMQERYAQGMGGFRESPEIGLPPALEQARGIGLPGYAMPGGGAGAPGPAPGLSGGASPPAPPPSPPNALGLGAVGAVQAPGGAVPSSSGISNTTDAGGVPREYTPASVTGAGSGLPPGGPRGGIEPEPLASPGQGRIEPEPAQAAGPPLSGHGDPRLQLEGMGAAFQGAAGFAGAPVAAGGAGMWDPMQAMQGMLGQGGDAAWEEAVRRAAGSFGRYG